MTSPFVMWQRWKRKRRNRQAAKLKARVAELEAELKNARETIRLYRVRHAAGRKLLHDTKEAFDTYLFRDTARTLLSTNPRE